MLKRGEISRTHSGGPRRLGARQTTVNMPFAKMSGLIRSRLPSSAVRISACSTRQIHASLVASRRAPVKKTDDPFDIDQIPDYQYDDTTSLGHRILRERRKYLTYLRLIEDEVPKLEREPSS